MARAEKLPLVLASGSAARATMLHNAGLSFSIIPADIDEAEIQKQNFGAGKIAQKLARAKALHIAKAQPEALVIGADQVLELDGKIMNKAQDKAQAREKLLQLKGKSHRLISAVCVAKGHQVLWEKQDEATLKMHDFNEAFLEAYMDAAGEALSRAVGAYELESAGAWLFERVQGDYFTVLGMPLLPLLNYLRHYHGCEP